MIGPSLAELRTWIEDLASGTGDYYLVCARHGGRPVPAGSLRFEDRATARVAARATEQYRAALRRYDPRLPEYDVVVCQGAATAGGTGRDTDAASIGNGDEWSLSEPVVGAAMPDPTESTGDPGVTDDPMAADRPSAPGRSDLVAFAHRLAAAVFETLSDRGYGAAESAVMDAYVELAGTVADRDDLCLRLLERMAAALDRQLTPAEQAAVLDGAATRLPPADGAGKADRVDEADRVDGADRPVASALSLLAERGLLGSYTRSPWSVDLDDGTRSVVVRLSGYALAPRDGRLPVLPLVLELRRRRPDRAPAAVDVVDLEEGWLLTLLGAPAAEPSGLAAAPIVLEV